MQYQTIEEVSKYKTLLLKGTPGSGKTTLAAHWPKPVFFDFDHNLTGLQKLPAELKKDLKVIDPRYDGDKRLKGRAVWDNTMKLTAEVFQDPDVETIIFDSLTTMQEVLMDKILSSEDPAMQMKLQDWGTIQRYWKTFAEEILCNGDLDKHVIMTAHERTVEETSPNGSKTVKYGLNLQGSMKDAFDLFFSDVWRTYIDTSKGGVRYMVATDPHMYYSAKRSLECPAMFEWNKEKERILAQL